MIEDGMKGYADTMEKAAKQERGEKRRAAADAAFAERVHAMACAIVTANPPDGDSKRTPQSLVAEAAISLVREIDNAIEDLYEEGDS